MGTDPIHTETDIEIMGSRLATQYSIRISPRRVDIAVNEKRDETS